MWKVCKIQWFCLSKGYQTIHFESVAVLLHSLSSTKFSDNFLNWTFYGYNTTCTFEDGT